MQPDDLIKVAQLRNRKSYGKHEDAQDEGKAFLVISNLTFV
jgi:hypothetical protein